MNHRSYAGVLADTLANRCPACSKASLYQKWYMVAVSDSCHHCGFSFKDHDAADGPAYVAMFVGSIIVVCSVLILEFMFSAPWWVYLLVWMPLSAYIMLILLRWSKTFFITLQYRHNVNGFRDRN